MCFSNVHFLCPFHCRFLVLCHILRQCPPCVLSCILESNLDKLISLVLEITEDYSCLPFGDIVLLSNTRQVKHLGATCLEWARQTCPELATLLALGPSPCLQDVQDVLAPAPQRDKHDSMTSGFQVEALLISIFGLRSFGFSSKTVSSDGARSRTNAFIHNSGRAQSHEVAN